VYKPRWRAPDADLCKGGRPSLDCRYSNKVWGAPVRMLVLDLWIQLTAKKLSRKSVNQQMSISNATAWIVTRPQIKKLSFTIKKAAIKSIMDGTKTVVVERRSIGLQTGDGTMDVDVAAERATMDQARATSWHMKRSALVELLLKSIEVLAHTGGTS